MEQNTVIISLEEYDKLKSFERVILDESETIFYEGFTDSVQNFSIYNNSTAHYDLVEVNNNLKGKIDRLNKRILELEKQQEPVKRNFISRLFKT